MPLKSLTKRFLDSIQPKGTITVYIDKNIKSLILRHHPTNKKSFYICLNTNGTRICKFIGTYPALNPDHARNIVKLELVKTYINLDIQPIQNKKSEIFQLYMNQFMGEHSSNVKLTTKKLHERLLKNHILQAFKSLPIANISHNNIITFKQSLQSKTTTYNRCHQLLNVFFKYCTTHNIIKANSMLNIKKYKKHTRQEYLIQKQYKAFMQSSYELLKSKKISQLAVYCILFIC